ncbi:hypothetical protein [Denitratimonas tolerans]|jgi:hypothetical protein|uniref:hypothetical protein n=1 Tax=Denitratimonas tolerans TaxID=1338420 RepID=UPI00307790EA
MHPDFQVSPVTVLDDTRHPGLGRARLATRVAVFEGSANDIRARSNQPTPASASFLPHFHHPRVGFNVRQNPSTRASLPTVSIVGNRSGQGCGRLRRAPDIHVADIEVPVANGPGAGAWRAAPPSVGEGRHGPEMLRT